MAIPSWALLQRIVGYFNVIWDEAELMQKLAALSDPNVAVDTSNLSEQATKTANLLAAHIDNLDDETLEMLSDLILQASEKHQD